MNPLTISAAIIAFGNLGYFAWKIITRKADPMNIVSWLLFSVLQLFILLGSMKTMESFLLSAAFTVGTVVVFVANLFVGHWKWTKVETWSTICVGISATAWQLLEGDTGVVAGVISLNIAAVPLIMQTWEEPDKEAALMYFLAVVSCILTLAGSYPWSFVGSCFPLAGMIFNGFMLLLCTRKVIDTEETSTYSD